MQPLQTLYEHFVNCGKDNPKLKRMWVVMDETVKREIPANYQEDFNIMLSNLADTIQYQGFTVGFYTAIALWKELEDVHKDD